MIEILIKTPVAHDSLNTRTELGLQLRSAGDKNTAQIIFYYFIY